MKSLTHFSSKIRFKPRTLPIRRDFSPWQGKGETMLVLLMIFWPRLGLVFSQPPGKCKLNYRQHLIQSEWLPSRNLAKSVGKDVGKRKEPLIIWLVGVQMTTAIMELSKGVSPKNNHHMTQLYYSYVTSENYLTTKILVHHYCCVHKSK